MRRQKAVDRDFDGALQTTDEVIAKDAKNADAWKLKGDVLLYGQGKVGRRAGRVSQVHRCQRDLLSRAHLAVLAVLLQQGKLDDTATQLEKLKGFAANHPQTKYFDAQLAYHKKDFKRARELSQQLLQLAPNNPRLLQLAGAVELQLGALSQAEIYLGMANEAAPQLGLARRLLIATYLRSGQAAKALTTLNQGVGKDGIEPALYSLAGEVYLQNGDASEGGGVLRQGAETRSRQCPQAHRAGHHPSGGRAAGRAASRSCRTSPNRMPASPPTWR